MRKQELHPRTAVVNKTQKKQSKNARMEALAWLAGTFPEAFDSSLRIRPLKIGIMSDILLHAAKAEEAGISRSKLREAIVVFTRRMDYLACLKHREMRIDFYGNDVSEVTAEEAEHAAAKIKKRIEKSIKNSRKNMAEKNTLGTPSPRSSNYLAKTSNQDFTPPEEFSPVYPLRSNAYGTISPSVKPAKTATVLVKHKATRAYDPDAVARLKAKLGLSRSHGEKERQES